MEIKTNGILFGMNRKELNSTLSDLSSKAEKFTEPVAREVCHTSFDLVEYFFEKTEVQDKKIQKMQDEINLLKGEKGQPDVNKQSGNNGKNNNHSSENERKNRDPKKPRKPGGTKKASVTVDRIMNIPVDKSTLPEGMTRHGTTSTVVQDIHFGTDNIEFRRETYYNKEEASRYCTNVRDLIHS